ncbi:MAG: methionine--tRNA ligase [Candidatus Korarchaeum sp.]|jgi:methionyl-tRNA synthetase|nr:methionine--tRNA ligase [Candidatus Korarchaeum sp.]
MRWIVASAWPYINAVPHLGTLVQVLSSDVFARFLRKMGEEVVFVSGSDEHGTPIEIEAIRRGIAPKELTDKMHEYVTRLFESFGISYDNYTRTESDVHKEFVRDFYLKIYNEGHIFERETEQLYCPKDELFLPDRFVTGTCPYCGYERAHGDQCDRCGRLLNPTDLIDPKCSICGSVPEVRRTKHWFFDLPKFSEKLRKYIEENDNLPENAKALSLSMIEEGLRPRSLTRDNKWGIPAPFPGSEGKTIYVWMEAVLGYISAVKEYFLRRGETGKFEEFWKSEDTRSIYFIGKDNIPFHTIIFPALLMASGENYVLPFSVASTEFLLYEGEKFSKSERRGIWMDEALQLLPADYWRFYMIYMRPELKDTSFSWEDFESKVNDELNDTIGNLIHRVLSFIASRYGGQVPSVELDEEASSFLKRVREMSREIEENLMKIRLRDALRAFIEIARLGNRFFNNREPWKDFESNRKRADSTVLASYILIKIIAFYMHIFMPSSAEKLWNMLGLEGEPNARVAFSEHENGKVRSLEPLFRKIKKEELLDRLKQMREKGEVLSARES